MQCGFVHEFVGDAVELWKLRSGYPPAPEPAPQPAT
jgi:hypothetical protein